MTVMKKLPILLLLLVFIATAAGAQEVADDSYQFILAKLAAEDGRFDEALASMDKLIAHHPDDVVLQYERGMMLIDAGKIDQAETAMRKVVAAKPDFYDAQRVLGRIIIDRAGTDRTKVDEALQHLQMAWKLNPDDLATGMAVSQILINTDRAAEAERVLASMLERAPDQRALNYNYAMVLTKLGRGNESKPYLERAVEVDPTYLPAVQQLIDIYQKENDFDKAAAVLQPIINDDPANIDLLKQQAFFYLRAGEADKAKNALKTIVAADPKDSRAQFYLAEAYNDLEQYDEADKIYRKLLEQTPDDGEVLASYGLSQMGQRKWDEAAKTFETMLKVNDLPDNLQMLAKTQLAAIHLQDGKYEQALEESKPLLVFHDKPNGQAVNTALEVLKRTKHYSEGVALLQPLVDKYSSDPFVNSRYIDFLIRAGDKDRARVAAATQVKFGVRNTIGAAEAYIQNDDYTPALQILNDAAKAKPDDLDLQFELGSAYERSGDKKTAETIFLAILKKHPDNTQTLNYLGYMWAESGVNLDRAQDMLTRAVSAEPRNGAFIDSLGWLYFRQGKLDLAEKYLTDATRLLPHDATVHEHLADVLAKRGERVKALNIYRNALKMEPDPKDEAKLRSKIAEIEKQQQAAQR